ncbi:glycosyltransferase family 39 protein [Stetteria hydrogenophila]
MKRLSYADAWPAALLLAGLALSAALGVMVYRESRGIAASLEPYTSDEIYYVDTARRILQRVFGVHSVSWWGYSGKTDEGYMNTEHPPLGKYIIGLSMLLCGDRPGCWRLPGSLEAAAIPVILYLGYAAAGRRLGSPALGAAAGVAAAAAAAGDRILVEESAVAMLDIHLAFFTAVAVAAAAAGRVRLAYTSAALAAAVKYSGAFILPAVWLASLYWARDRRGLARLVGESLLAALLVQLALWAPLAVKLGGGDWPRWLLDQFTGALSWHTSPRPSGPPTSPPWLWWLNWNPSHLSYQPVIGGEVSTLIHAAALPAAAGLAAACAPRRCPAAGSYSLAWIMLGYTAVYLAGNNTLYSFYAVHLTPAAAGVMGDLTLAPSAAGRAAG